MRQIDISYRIKKTIGAILKCKKTANIFSIRIRDKYSGETEGIDTYATCLSKIKVDEVMNESIKECKGDITKIWTIFESKMGNNIVKMPEYNLYYSF